MSADGAFLDGRVFTGERYAEAFLVEDGRIVAIGTSAAVRRERPVGSRVHRLGGRLVIPGLIDPHLHLAAIVRMRRGVPLAGVGGFDELVSRLERWAGEHPAEPVIGRGWDERQFVEGRAPTRGDLDRAHTAQPVVLYRVCGHAAAVNSVVLEQLGAGRTAPPVLGGRFGLGPDGRPNGLLYDGALDRLPVLVDPAPRLSAEDLRMVLHEAAMVGLTTVGSVNSPPEELTAVAKLATGPNLPVRVRLYPPAESWRPGDPLPNVRPRGEPRSIVRGLKAITDGSFGARTAWLDAPYADDPTTSGLPVWSVEKLRELGRAAAEEGIPLALHAIGDRALATVLGVFEDASAIPSPRIEHASLVPPALAGRLASFRGTVVVQPHFAETDGWIPERLGVERARWAYPWRSLLTAGARLAGSSDAPFDAFDPWDGLQAAVEGAPWRRSKQRKDPERLSPEEAVAAYTIGGARALGEPGPSGLSVGAPADFVVVRAKDLESAVTGRARDGLTTFIAGAPVAERRPPRRSPAGRC
jgi:predicted amidohydrolase YtcJ